MRANEGVKANGRRTRGTQASSAGAKNVAVDVSMAAEAPIIESETERGSVPGQPLAPESDLSSKASKDRASKDKAGEEVMSADQVVQITPRPMQAEAEEPVKGGAIQVHQLGKMMGNRPIAPSEIEICGTISEAGIRPIAASHLEVVASLLGNRPIEASHLTVHSSLPGNQPIFTSDLTIFDTETLPGHRPILASDPQLMQGSTLAGNRPIAPNDVDEAPVLMGFID